VFDFFFFIFFFSGRVVYNQPAKETCHYGNYLTTKEGGHQEQYCANLDIEGKVRGLTFQN